MTNQRDTVAYMHILLLLLCYFFTLVCVLISSTSGRVLKKKMNGILLVRDGGVSVKDSVKWIVIICLVKLYQGPRCRCLP